MYIDTSLNGPKGLKNKLCCYVIKSIILNLST
jgi:hypothetical protein